MATSDKVTFSQKVRHAAAGRGVKGIYLSGKLVRGNYSLDDITRTGPIIPTTITPSAAIRDKSDTVTGVSVALGYAIPFLVAPSRVEIEYQYYPEVNYNASPALIPTDQDFFQSLRSNIQTQTVMGNFYYDLNLGYRFVPYVGAGVGAAFNRADSTVTDNSLDGGGAQTSTSNSNTSFAWNLRAGTRFLITPSAIIDVAYEYASLGRGTWTLLGNGLETNDIASSMINVGFTWQFG